MASGGGSPRRLVASRGGGRAGDIQSRRPELGGRGAGRRLREAGGVEGRPVERVEWRSGQGRRAAASKAGRARAWGGRAGPGGNRQCRGWWPRKGCKGRAPVGRWRAGRRRL
jgi:hypothetical protein